MKNFLVSFLIFISPCIGIGIGMELLLRKIPNIYSYKSNYLDKNSNNIEVLLLGTSHVYLGINPAYMGMKSFNAAHVAQTLNFDLEIIKKYKDKWNSLKVIVMPIDYPSFYARLEYAQHDVSELLKNYTIYYRIYKTFNVSYNFEIFCNQLKKNIEQLDKYYIKKNSTIPCTSLGYGIKTKLKGEELDISGVTKAKSHTFNNDRFFEENVGVVKDIVRFAQTKDIKVIFFTAPAYKSYVKNLDSRQLNRTVSTITQIADSHPNTRYYNFLTDKTFIESDFFDADHLVEKGVKKLTLKIDSLVNVACRKDSLK